MNFVSKYTILSFCPSQWEKTTPDPFVLLKRHLSACTHRHLNIRIFFASVKNKLLTFSFKIEDQVFEVVEKYLKQNPDKERSWDNTII